MQNEMQQRPWPSVRKQCVASLLRRNWQPPLNAEMKTSMSKCLQKWQALVKRPRRALCWMMTGNRWPSRAKLSRWTKQPSPICFLFWIFRNTRKLARRPFSIKPQQRLTKLDLIMHKQRLSIGIRKWPLDPTDRPPIGSLVFNQAFTFTSC